MDAMPERKMPERRRRAWPVLLVLVVAAGCASERGMLPPASEPPDAEYVIGEGDVLQVRVWKNEELSVEVPVRADGHISVPLLDDIPAAGRTPVELKGAITEALSEYISHPDVTVVVTQMASKRAYVLGEVARSGPVSLVTPLRITDAITAAGGFGPFADKGDVKLIRRTADGEQEYIFDYDAYVRGRAPDSNVYLQPGDTVVVPD